MYLVFLITEVTKDQFFFVIYHQLNVYVLAT